MKVLRLSPDLVLPLEAVTEKMAWLGRTGQGKTYAAMKAAELMLEAGAQIGVIDPVGVWPGLRIPAEKGGAAFDVVVFGGLRGDLPLEATAGELIADLVSDRGISFVLDVSQFIPSEQQKFVRTFADRFFHRKKSAPSAIHLFMEECQEFLPENPSGAEALTLGVMQRLWKLGRNFGIGGSLISQRPQEIAKKALNMSGTLFAFQMTGPQERAAVKKWVSDHDVAADIESVLQTLKRGEPHVEMLMETQEGKVYRHSGVVRIAERVTADLSSTPKVGGSAAARRPLTPIDVEQLKTAMAATIEKAKADDPKELRVQLAAAKTLLAKKEAVLAEVDARTKVIDEKLSRVKAKTVPVLKDAQVKRVERLVHQCELLSERLGGAWEGCLNQLRTITDQLAQRQQVVVTEVGNLRAQIKAAVAATQPGGANERVTVGGAGRPSSSGARPAPASPRVAAPRAQPSGNGHVNLGPGRDRILAALILHGRPLARAELGVFSVMSATGGTFKTYLPQLIREGLVAEEGNRLRITDAGHAALREPAETITPGSNATLHAAWLDQVQGGMKRLLSHLIATYPNWITRTELGDAIDMAATGGTFKTYFPKLVRLGLVESNRDGVRATDHLFGFAG